MKPEVTIRNWKVILDPFTLTSDPFTFKCLYGEVFGHPHIPDGHHIVSSEILVLDEANSRVETRNSIYILADQPA